MLGKIFDIIKVRELYSLSDRSHFYTKVVKWVAIESENNNIIITSKTGRGVFLINCCFNSIEKKLKQKVNLDSFKTIINPVCAR